MTIRDECSMVCDRLGLQQQDDEPRDKATGFTMCQVWELPGRRDNVYLTRSGSVRIGRTANSAGPIAGSGSREASEQLEKLLRLLLPQ